MESFLNGNTHVKVGQMFIDFGEESLFMVKEGMGTTQIRGTYLSKERFIKKYGGNYEYYCQQQLKTHASSKVG